MWLSLPDTWQQVCLTNSIAKSAKSTVNEMWRKAQKRSLHLWPQSSFFGGPTILGPATFFWAIFWWKGRPLFGGPPTTHANHGMSLLVLVPQTAPDWRAAVFCSRFRVQWIFAKLGGEAAYPPTSWPYTPESGNPQWGRISYPPVVRLLIFPLEPERPDRAQWRPEFALTTLKDQNIWPKQKPCRDGIAPILWNGHILPIEKLLDCVFKFQIRIQSILGLPSCFGLLFLVSIQLEVVIENRKSS